MTNLATQTIWLVGASHGIGEKLARALVQRGATVAISARSEDKLNIIADTLGERCIAVPCDVSDNTTITRAYVDICKKAATPDMMIYCAGIYDPMSSADFDLTKVEQMLDINLHGAIRTLHTILPDMKARRSGRIVLFGSVAGYRGLPKAMGYGMTKAALIHLAENLRQDLEGSGLNVTIINPGFVKTRLTDKNTFDMPAQIAPDEAADYIIKGLQNDQYEIHFPKRLTLTLKALRLLPSNLYFWLSGKLL